MSDAAPPTPLEDLLARAKAGDRAALEELFDDRVRQYMKHIAAPRSPRTGEADSSDVVQEASLLAFQRFSQFEGSSAGEFFAWLKTIVLRKADDLRRRHHEVEPLRETSSGQLQIAGKELPKQVQILQEALGRLAPHEREVIELFQFDGMSHREIAALLGKTEAAVRKMYSRAVQHLGELLGDSTP